MIGLCCVREVYCPICHRDGTVSYWSTRRQEWITFQEIMPDEDLAVIPFDEAARVRRHLDNHRLMQSA